MLAKVTSCAILGLEGAVVDVEVDVLPGLPNVTVVGLPDAAVQESRERVRSAIKNSGAKFPDQRVTINLAPADLRKEGPSYDLPIALGILCATNEWDLAVLEASSHPDPAALAAANRRFHWAILRPGPRADRVLSGLWDASEAYRARWFAEHGNVRRGADEHARLLDAVVARDADRVVRLLDAHRAGAIEALRHRLDD